MTLKDFRECEHLLHDQVSWHLAKAASCFYGQNEFKSLFEKIIKEKNLCEH